MSDCQAGGKNSCLSSFDIDFCSCSRTNQRSGDPEYSDVRNEFYKNVDGAMLTFDVTCKRSFESLGSWLKEASGYGLSSDFTMTMLVVGNKIDHRPREVTEQEVRTLALQRRCDTIPPFPSSIQCLDTISFHSQSHFLSRKINRVWNSPSRITPPTSRLARRPVWASMTCSSTCCMNERAMKKGGFWRWLGRRRWNDTDDEINGGIHV